MRAAAAITSMTMNGGTSLRAEGLINRRAASNIASVPSTPGAGAAPLSPHFRAQFAS
jgi:Flp pilus assembly secretin CpaC